MDPLRSGKIFRIKNTDALRSPVPLLGRHRHRSRVSVAAPITVSRSNHHVGQHHSNAKRPQHASMVAIPMRDAKTRKSATSHQQQVSSSFPARTKVKVIKLASTGANESVSGLALSPEKSPFRPTTGALRPSSAPSTRVARPTAVRKSLLAQPQRPFPPQQGQANSKSSISRDHSISRSSPPPQPNHSTSASPAQPTAQVSRSYQPPKIDWRSTRRAFDSLVKASPIPQRVKKSTAPLATISSLFDQPRATSPSSSAPPPLSDQGPRSRTGAAKSEHPSMSPQGVLAQGDATPREEPPQLSSAELSSPDRSEHSSVTAKAPAQGESHEPEDSQSPTLTEHRREDSVQRASDGLPELRLFDMLARKVSEKEARLTSPRKKTGPKQASPSKSAKATRLGQRKNSSSSSNANSEHGGAEDTGAADAKAKISTHTAAVDFTVTLDGGDSSFGETYDDSHEPLGRDNIDDTDGGGDNRSDDDDDDDFIRTTPRSRHRRAKALQRSRQSNKMQKAQPPSASKKRVPTNTGTDAKITPRSTRRHSKGREATNSPDGEGSHHSYPSPFSFSNMGRTTPSTSSQSSLLSPATATPKSKRKRKVTLSSQHAQMKHPESEQPHVVDEDTGESQQQQQQHERQRNSERDEIAVGMHAVTFTSSASRMVNNPEPTLGGKKASNPVKRRHAAKPSSSKTENNHGVHGSNGSGDIASRNVHKTPSSLQKQSKKWGHADLDILVATPTPTPTRKSRSGRLVKPPLAYWKNERALTDTHGNFIEISPSTPDEAMVRRSKLKHRLALKRSTEQSSDEESPEPVASSSSQLSPEHVGPQQPRTRPRHGNNESEVGHVSDASADESEGNNDTRNGVPDLDVTDIDVAPRRTHVSTRSKKSRQGRTNGGRSQKQHAQRQGNAREASQRSATRRTTRSATSHGNGSDGDGDSDDDGNRDGDSNRGRNDADDDGSGDSSSSDSESEDRTAGKSKKESGRRKNETCGKKSTRQGLRSNHQGSAADTEAANDDMASSAVAVSPVTRSQRKRKPKPRQPSRKNSAHEKGASRPAPMSRPSNATTRASIDANVDVDRDEDADEDEDKDGDSEGSDVPLRRSTRLRKKRASKKKKKQEKGEVGGARAISGKRKGATSKSTNETLTVASPTTRKRSKPGTGDEKAHGDAKGQGDANDVRKESKHQDKPKRDRRGPVGVKKTSKSASASANDRGRENASNEDKTNVQQRDNGDDGDDDDDGIPNEFGWTKRELSLLSRAVDYATKASTNVWVYAARVLGKNRSPGDCCEMYTVMMSSSRTLAVATQAEGTSSGHAVTTDPAQKGAAAKKGGKKTKAKTKGGKKKQGKKQKHGNESSVGAGSDKQLPSPSPSDDSAVKESCETAAAPQQQQQQQASSSTSMSNAATNARRDGQQRQEKLLHAISAKEGTLARKRQIRDFLIGRNENYEDDWFKRERDGSDLVVAATQPSAAVKDDDERNNTGDAKEGNPKEVASTLTETSTAADCASSLTGHEEATTLEAEATSGEPACKREKRLQQQQQLEEGRNGEEEASASTSFDNERREMVQKEASKEGLGKPGSGTDSPNQPKAKGRTKSGTSGTLSSALLQSIPDFSDCVDSPVRVRTVAADGQASSPQEQASTNACATPRHADGMDVDSPGLLKGNVDHDRVDAYVRQMFGAKSRLTISQHRQNSAKHNALALPFTKKEFKALAKTDSQQRHLTQGGSEGNDGSDDDEEEEDDGGFGYYWSEVDDDDNESDGDAVSVDDDYVGCSGRLVKAQTEAPLSHAVSATDGSNGGNAMKTKKKKTMPMKKSRAAPGSEAIEDESDDEGR